MTPAERAARRLQTADERREDVLAAARPQFARKGFYGTPTAEIARDAGISQAYLFRLFPTKEELFIAVTERCMEAVGEAFRRAAAPHAGDEDAMFAAMGEAYEGLLADRDMLLAQLQAYAACEEPAIGDAVRRRYGLLVDMVRETTGAAEERVTAFFATGMLLTVIAAIGAHELDEPWARSLMAGIDEDC
ncbi:MAG TPA: helix-turn-helix domain-containing protein [Solirubrobacteraceae bacterium]|nr:helix-turn-helix domain-containing protein [Solirubrobacteraceae bacterium]